MANMTEGRLYTKSRGRAPGRLADTVVERATVQPRDEAADVGERRLQYQPALDGLRALAVGAVLAYHADLPWARGGYLGVDAFFVLSGYLITSLLLVEWRASGTIDLRAFWARRARRLLPALFLVLAGVTAYAVVFAEPEELDKLRSNALATLGYVANWQLAFSGQSYFDQFSVPSPLRHTWSLAIEEQWYLIWPLLVVLLLRWRRGSLLPLFAVSLVMIAGSALLMAWLYDPGADPSRVYYGTDTRAQSLLVGAVLAMLLMWHGPIRAVAARRLLQLAALGCAVYVGWLWARTSDDSVFLYQGGFLLSALAVAVVIAAVVQSQRGLLGGLLSLEPLRRLGLISYGIYLWHWPIYLVLTSERTGWHGTSLLAAKVGLTLAIAIASYYLLETPVRRGALRSWRAWTIAPAATAVLVVGLIMVTRGGTQPFAFPDVEQARVAASITDLSVTVPVQETPVPPTRVLLVGDSVAWTMGVGLYAQQENLTFVLRTATTLGCGLVRGTVGLEELPLANDRECDDWPQRWRLEVENFQPDVAVMLFGFHDVHDRKIDGRLLEFGTPEADDYVLSELQAAIDVLSSDDAKVVLLTAPYFKTGLASDTWRIDHFNLLFRRAARLNEGQVTIVDLSGFVNPAGEFADRIDGLKVIGDGVHFTQEGAALVGRWLAPRIVELAGGEGNNTQTTNAFDLFGAALDTPTRP
jgi:peptidoglycan/LPS O-acetylase OafA/YrhL